MKWRRNNAKDRTAEEAGNGDINVRYTIEFTRQGMNLLFTEDVTTIQQVIEQNTDCAFSQVQDT